MPQPPRIRLLFALVAAFSVPAPPAWAQPKGTYQITASTADPRLSDLRRGAAQWTLRAGPSRRVVDMVCLVPDVPTFYEALAAWDEDRFFPILIDDVELDLKFLRAFRPARVVRYPGRGKPIEPGGEWSRAVQAVGDAWSAPGAPAESRTLGDRTPERLGRTPPGVVVGHDESPALPGLAALAAGRFQPMVRLDSPKPYSIPLNAAEAEAFSDALDAALRPVVPRFDRLGDDCDFLTLAGDYPYRYVDAKAATLAIDDRLGRDRSGRRWAFAGRLMGEPRRAVYAAMCSLFLRPDSALFFDTYSETAEPWKYWSLRNASPRLAPLVRVTLTIPEPRATLAAWHGALAPPGRSGLFFVNSQGSPRTFALTAGGAHALDVMPGGPAVVSMIHSYSASDPTDPDSIAGRWLAQGAFLYHGSMDEPYLLAFRPPAVVAALLADGVPFAAAVRPMPTEPFGEPWKLVVLGDPLYTIARMEAPRPRAQDAPTPPEWIPYTSTPPPAPDAPEASRLAWAVNAALFETTARAADSSAGIVAVLRSIDRGRLPENLRPVFDDLMAVLLYGLGQLDALRATVAAVPKAERTPVATRLALAATLADLSRALAAQDFDRACAAWSALIRSEADAEFKRAVTSRLGPLADAPSRRDVWRARLRSTLGGGAAADVRDVITAELKRIEGAR
jgi:hypothetical protein